jgi:hypothetical protein
MIVIIAALAEISKSAADCRCVTSTPSTGDPVDRKRKTAVDDRAEGRLGDGTRGTPRHRGPQPPLPIGSSSVLTTSVLAGPPYPELLVALAGNTSSLHPFGLTGHHHFTHRHDAQSPSSRRSSRSAGTGPIKPRGVAERFELLDADQGAGLMQQPGEDVGPAFVAHGQAPVADQPRERAFDPPAVTAQPLARLHLTSGDPGADPATARHPAAARVVVALSACNLTGRPAPGPRRAVAGREARRSIRSRADRWPSTGRWFGPVFIPGAAQAQRPGGGPRSSCARSTRRWSMSSGGLSSRCYHSRSRRTRWGVTGPGVPGRVCFRGS